MKINEIKKQIEEMEKEAIEAVRNRLSYELPLQADIKWIEMAMTKRERAISYYRKLLAEAYQQGLRGSVLPDYER